MTINPDSNIQSENKHFVRLATDFIKQNLRVLSRVYLIWIGVVTLLISILGAFWHNFLLVFEPYLHLPLPLRDMVDQFQLQLVLVNVVLVFLILIPLISFLTHSVILFVKSSGKKLEAATLTRSMWVNIGWVFIAYIIATLVWFLINLLTGILEYVAMVTIAPVAAYVLYVLLLLLIYPFIIYAWHAAFISRFHYKCDYFTAFVENLELAAFDAKKVWITGLGMLIVLLCANSVALLPAFFAAGLFEALGGGTLFILLFAFILLLALFITTLLYSLTFYIAGFGYYDLVTRYDKLPLKGTVNRGLSME